jgi:hypothetical protein
MKITKEWKLFEWCKFKKVFSYVDINNYKSVNFYLRADRTIRDFVIEGKIRRIPDDEALLRSLRKEGNQALAWFEVL